MYKRQYQGAPTPITAFLSVGSKAAGFIVFLRLVSPFLASDDLADKVTLVLAIIASITLIMGNFAAMPQKNFKRLLAYSSVAHAGFLLMALASAPTKSSEGSLSPATVVTFYLGAYLLMTLLAFLVITTVRNSIAGEEIESYKGLAKRSPFLAFMLIISMASLAGIPLTAGFYGKLFVFKIAADQGNWTLLVIGLIGAAAGFYYYLKVAVPVFFDNPTKDEGEKLSTIHVSAPARTAMVILTIAIIAAGVNPNLIIGLFS